MENFVLGVVSSLIASAIVFFAGQFLLVWRKRTRVFMSIPMETADGVGKYSEFKETAKQIGMRVRNAGYQVSCAILDIENPTKFEEPAKTAPDVLRKIRASKYFLLVLPERMPSSCLIELGYALALKKQIIALVRNDRQEEKQTLPWLARGIQKIPGSNKTVKLIKFDDLSKLADLFDNNVPRLFQD